MIDEIKFKKINDYDILYVGCIIKGYTYSPSDFHRYNTIIDKWQGESKLRLGVIVENYNNEYFKIQFRNSNAVKQSDLWSVNKINVKISNESDFYIYGEDKYCIIVDRSQIVRISTMKTNFIGPIEKIQENIYKKHNTQRKRATLYFRKQLYLSRSKEVTDKILKIYQFSSSELKMANSVIYKKLRLIWFKHISDKYFCITNEIKKIEQVISLIIDNSDLCKIAQILLSIIVYNHDSDKKYKYDEENVITVLVKYFNPKKRYE